MEPEVRERSAKQRVGGGHTRHIGEELVLMSKHWTRSNDRGSGECFADSALTGSLGAIELGCRGRRSIEVRYVDQPWNANARRDFSNTPSTIYVYIVKSEISFL